METGSVKRQIESRETNVGGGLGEANLRKPRMVGIAAGRSGMATASDFGLRWWDANRT
jgi:hypothetical protein